MYDDNNDGGLAEFEQRDREQQVREPMQVYKAICAVAREMSTEGISKDRKNQQQGYNFRGIDDVYNSLAPMLARNGLVILPRMISREVTERETAKGGTLFYVIVEAEFDFVSAEDGSHHTVRTFGEAMDSGDKATNKAMSAAYKYAAFQAFCIPTAGDNDADATTHEVKPRAIKQKDVKSNPNNSVVMDDAIITAIKESQNLDDLQRIFGAAYTAATPEQRLTLKTTYDAAKQTLLGSQA